LKKPTSKNDIIYISMYALKLYFQDFYGALTSFVFSIPEPWQGDREHNELDKNHITSQSMGDSFYHIFTTP
jgi:hypothetical protein